MRWDDDWYPFGVFFVAVFLAGLTVALVFAILPDRGPKHGACYRYAAGGGKSGGYYTEVRCP